jgi:cAMP phosphodiesterase
MLRQAQHDTTTMKYLFLLTLLIVNCQLSIAQNAFKVIPLGVKGGLDESNLSAYLVAPEGSDTYVCLDAGTIYSGVEKAITNKLVKGDAQSFIKNNIKAYLISHAHLDHVSGLVLNSVDDTTKNIYGLPFMLDYLQKHYFNWKSWPNFGSDGDSPALKKYQYKFLAPGAETKIENTALSAKTFPLSHSTPYQSSAFLLRNNDNYILYFGDTGADELEKSNRMESVWKEIAPLVKEKKLKAIFLEVSYPDEQADNKLYGHLTPKWLMHEMEALAKLAGKDALKELNVIITHIKPTGNNEEMIKKQLSEQNKYKLNFIFAEQGVLYNF